MEYLLHPITPAFALMTIVIRDEGVLLTTLVSCGSLSLN
jgi:hypothetical protein